MTAAFDPTFPGDRELERRLEAFADLRLSPSGATITRAKMQVMAVAHRRAALIEAGRAAEPTSRTPHPGPIVASAWTRGWLRPLGALTVAVMTLGMLAGTAAATRPGGPLYAVLLDAERLTLPRDISALVVAETRRLDNRMHEALAASQAGDEVAAVAALTAYSSIIFEAATEVDGDQDAERVIQSVVVEHAPALSSMLVWVPEPARAEVEAAIFDSTRFLHRHDGASGMSPASDRRHSP